MRVRLIDCIEFAAVDVTYVNDRVVRFRLQSPRLPSEYQRFLLNELASMDEVYPEAPNREAIAYNLASLEKLLNVGLARTRDVVSAAGILMRTARDFLAFNVDHFCDPTYLYTNGQAIASLVRRNESRFELAYHPSLSGFDSFVSEHMWNNLIQAENLHFASTQEQAEGVARELLSPVESYLIRAGKGPESADLVLQPAGSISGTDGYPVTTYIASFRDENFRVQMGGPPWGKDEPYRVLNTFRPHGFILTVCATCEHFRFSGMARDMSAGSTGYCTLGLGTRKSVRASDIVSVRHVCSEYSFVADEERITPYLRDPA